MCQDFPLHPRCDYSQTWSPSYPRSRLSSCGTSRGWTRRHWGCGWILSSSELEAAWNHNHDRPDNWYRTRSAVSVCVWQLPIWIQECACLRVWCHVLFVLDYIKSPITFITHSIDDHSRYHTFVWTCLWLSLMLMLYESAGRSSRLSGPDKNWF